MRVGPGRWVLAATIAAIGCSGVPAPQPEPGVDGVGFRRLDRWDTSRPYRAAAAPSGTPSHTPVARPMQIGVWYPARVTEDGAMTVGDYFRLAANEETLEPVTDEQGAAAVAELLANEWVAVPRLVERLDSAVDARLDAPPDGGPFPVVLYAPGSSAPWNDNYRLAETLAARGYVVLAARSRGLRHPDMSWDLQGIETGVRDLEFLYATAVDLPWADATRCAVVGRSWGAVPAVTFAHRNPEVDALVSLDGTISYNLEQLLESYPALPHGADLRVPSLIAAGLLRPDGATELDTRAYFEAVEQADVHELRYVHLPHVGFSSSYIDRYYLPSADEAVQARNPDLVASYALMVDDLTRFLDGYVVGERRPPRWPDDERRRARTRIVGPAPPGFDEFSRVVLDFGLEEARALHEATVARHPDHRMFNVWSLNRLVTAAISRGDYDEAIAVADFALDRYDDRAFLWVGRARAKWLRGDGEDAVVSLQRALEIAPEDRSAAALQARIEQGPAPGVAAAAEEAGREPG